MRPPPVVITAALTGSRITKDQTPYIPIAPAEIAAEGIGVEGDDMGPHGAAPSWAPHA